MMLEQLTGSGAQRFVSVGGLNNCLHTHAHSNATHVSAAFEVMEIKRTGCCEKKQIGSK